MARPGTAPQQPQQQSSRAAELLGLCPLLCCRAPLDWRTRHQRPTVQTIENQREKDETTVAADDEEVVADEAEDEFAAHFSR